MAIQHRYEFMILFEATDSNPNGDPDAGNAPRTDPETGHGLITDACTKRKIRDYIARAHAGRPKYGIYVQSGAVLARTKSDAYSALGLDVVAGESEEGAEQSEAEQSVPAPAPKGKVAKGKAVKLSAEDRKARVEAVRRKMMADYADIRFFGAVMSNAVDAGQVRGPVQLGIARSVDPVMPTALALTRCAVETEREAEAQGGGNRTMGKKWIVPYGLYVQRGYIVPSLAEDTGFGEEDLAILWEAIVRMFDDDRSAARGGMAVREVIVFKHENRLGKARAHELFDRVKIVRKDPGKPARAYADYTVFVDDMPTGVECLRIE